MARHHGQRAARRGLGGDHPERLGERARARPSPRLAGSRSASSAWSSRPAHTIRSARRRVALRRVARGTRAGTAARSPFSPRSVAAAPPRGPPASALQPLPERAEADDHQLGVRHPLEHERPGGEQQVDALGGDQLAHEDDQAVLRARSWRAPRRPPPGRARRRSRGFPAGAVASSRATRSLQARAGPHRARAGGTRAMSTPGGPSFVRASRLGVVHRRPQALGGVARADEHRAGAREPLAGVREEALRVRLDRVLERRAVDLDRVGDVVERPREDRRAHDEVVGERDVGRARARRPRARRRRCAPGSASSSASDSVRERLGLDPLVAVGDVDRQQAAEVGAVDGRPHRLAARLDSQRAGVPVPGRVDPLLLERLAVLAEQVDLVPRAHERGGQAGVVDVRAGAAQQIAVEDQDPHGAGP